MENIKLQWVAPFGPHKGELVSSWFQFGNPDIERLIKEYDAKVIDRA